MCITLRKDNDVAGTEPHRRLGVNLHEALTFRDEVEDDDALGMWLQQPSRRIGSRRLVTPGRGEPPLYEDSAHEAYNAQGFRERVHQLGSISMCNATGTTFSKAAETGEQR
jgi:hypothetical protein